MYEGPFEAEKSTAFATYSALPKRPRSAWAKASRAASGRLILVCEGASVGLGRAAIDPPAAAPRRGPEGRSGGRLRRGESGTLRRGAPGLAPETRGPMLTAKYHVYDSAVLDAPLRDVWGVVRDMMQLLPIVFGESVQDYRWVDGGSVDVVPSRFQFTLQPAGATALEEVSARSEIDHSVTYRMIGQAVGIEGYVATYRLLPVTSEPGKTFLDWHREFAVTPGQDAAQVSSFIADLCAQEVATLKAHFAKRRPGP
jgi:polyketide cyclase/dehydrase/lipid transport protein